MGHYLTVDVGHRIPNEGGQEVVFESATFDRTNLPSRMDLSQQTMQEIWDRNQDRMDDPKYAISPSEVAEIMFGHLRNPEFYK